MLEEHRLTVALRSLSSRAVPRLSAIGRVGPGKRMVCAHHATWRGPLVHGHLHMEAALRVGNKVGPLL